MAPNDRPAPLLPAGGKLFQQPCRSRLRIVPGPNGFFISFVRPRPNWWYRMWQRVFFGFIWEDISEQNTKRH